MINTKDLFNFEFKVLNKYNDKSVRASIFYNDFDGDKPSVSTIFGQLEKAYEGDRFKASGMFRDNEKGSYINLVSIPVLVFPSTKEEVAKYVAKQIKGITRITVDNVIDNLGEEFISKILQDNSVLDGILKKSQKEKMIEWCENHSHIDSVVVKTLNEGFRPKTAVKLYAAYGESAIFRLNQDPYALFLEGILSFAEADNYARKNNISNNRLEAGIYDFVMENEENGNMAVIPYCTYINSHLHSRYKKEEIGEAINNLCRQGLIVKYSRDSSSGVHRYIATPANLASEKLILNYVLGNHRTDILENEVLKRLSTDSRMAPKQKEAVAKCLSWHLSILTGGPGTGKTWTLQRLVETIKNLRKDAKISLMAPTGKASARMNELIKKKEYTATTIHAALALSADDDLAMKDGIVLDSDWVIIDECSMIDERLFAYFVRHISPNTHVVLCGDEQQLPSVQAGNLLYELLSIGVPSTTLTEIMRSKSTAINQNAHMIRNNKTDFITNNEFRFISCETTKITDEVVRLYQELRKTNPDNELLILSPIKEGLTGVNSINSRIQEAVNHNTEALRIKGKIFKVDDRVIQLKNNHKLNIHNGDIGTIVELKEKSLVVLFDGAEEPIELTDLENLQLAYAITVHKSQGSEANNIIMVFSTERGASFMLRKKLIYTALTRAKERFIGIGNYESFVSGSQNTEGENRVSLLRILYEEARK